MIPTIILALSFGSALADIYMHNPRGSNDRNCERNVNRQNGNRLFDSQNNAKGGYACPRAVGDENTQDEDGLANLGEGILQDKKMYFYENSILPIEWTNQHGCGQNSKVNCEVVIQYMCEDTADPQVDNFWPWSATKNNEENVGVQAFRSGKRIAAPRDGIPDSDDDDATDTIPDELEAAIPNTEDTRRFGMHESYDFYQNCQHLERNKGLYTADQYVRRRDARGTRQNPNGNRRGLECPEERDYYPWWQPSPWIDVAVLTNDAADTPCTSPEDCETFRCKYYLENSFNKNQKGYCDVDHAADDADVNDKLDSEAWNDNKWHNNQEECEADGFTWHMVKLDDHLTDLDYPVCAKTAFSRVNQLGNAYDSTISESQEDQGIPAGVNANRYLWTIPSVPTATSDYFEGGNEGLTGLDDAYQSCTLRIRYNLSTSDFPAWPEDAMEPGHPWEHAMVTAANNSKRSRRRRDDSAENQNTPLEQDPYIYMGAGDTEEADPMFLSLAVNTNQYARTFQDRSYKFAIRAKPSADEAADDDKDTPPVNTATINSAGKIYNVNVRGKRGNIVQTFPAVEYNFVPDQLILEENDVIHFQWTGSDYNPRRGCNDAEGGPPDPNNFVDSTKRNSRADRSNLVFMDYMADNVPMDYIGYTISEDGESTAELSYAEKVASMKTRMEDKVPCDPGDTECFDQVMRLSYLNQQSDGGSLTLRGDAPCLTQEELDDIDNKQERENHPLNCAKLNAKPYPYFDGGVMKASMPGKFSFFSTRNNNFSNRDQTGSICVKNADGSGCEVDAATGVLQGQNIALSGMAGFKTYANGKQSICDDEANAGGGAATDQGASSCIPENQIIINGETFTVEQAANDAMGDGDEESCEAIDFFFISTAKNSTEYYVVLAICLGLGGIVLSLIGFYVYNRMKRHQSIKEETNTAQFKAVKNTNENQMI